MSPVIGRALGQPAHPRGLPRFEFAWLEAPLDARLVRLADAPGWDDLARWPAGRIFGEAGEYRWQVSEDGAVHGVLLLDHDELPPPFEHPVALAREEGDEGEAGFLLWGDWVDPAQDPEGAPDDGPWFYAPEIPQAQRYPVAEGGKPAPGHRPRLLVRRYRAVERAQGAFIRCVGVALVADEGRAAGRE